MSENEPNMSVVSQGSHPGMQTRGIPFWGVFNHKGELVKAVVGAPDDAFIESLLKEAPSLYLGEEPFTKAGDLAKQVESGKNLGALMARLEGIAQGGVLPEGAKPLSEVDLALALDETGKAECQRLLDVLTRYAEAKLSAALSLEGSSPSGLIPALTQIEKELAGSNFTAEKITKTVAEKKADANLKTAIKIEGEAKGILKSLERLKSCQNCMRSGAKTMNPGCAGCKTANQKKIEETAAKLEALIEGKDIPYAQKVRDAIAGIK